MSLGVIEGELDRLRERHLATVDGELADYIPELATADPNWFGLSLCTADGVVHESGDSRVPFTIQSVSKPFVFALALSALGRDMVLEDIGVEPSGEAFNSIVLDALNRPHNAMVNAGAIATVGLLPGSVEERFEAIRTTLGAFAGRALVVDEAVYESELATGDRNRAIGHLLKNAGVLRGDVDETLEVYFRQCSLLVTSTDLAVMAATLANGGVNPISGDVVANPAVVGDVLSVMYTAGMYDFSGEWAYRTGLPAKSGVAGGVTALVPGQVGVGAFSPRVDERGNSVRGVAVCRELSERFGFHVFRGVASTRDPLGSTWSGAQRRSMRVRPTAEAEALNELGERIRVVEGQGHWSFVACERFFGHVERSEAEFVVLETSAIGSVDETACVLMEEFVTRLREQGRVVALAGPLPTGLEPLSAPQHETLDGALEAAENWLLARHERRCDGSAVQLGEADLCAGLSEEALADLESVMVERLLLPGEVLMKQGEPESSLFVVLSGHLMAEVQGRRVAAFGPGSMIGEMGFLSGDPRSATVIADESSRLAELGSLSRLDPELRAAVTRSIGTVISRRLSTTTAEVARS